jgi:hypothetical protein
MHNLKNAHLDFLRVTCYRDIHLTQRLRLNRKNGNTPSQLKVMVALIAATNQRQGPTCPVALDIQPPQMAPTKVSTNAIALRLRLPFFLKPANICSSLTRSHNRLVMTTVGTSLTPRPRLFTICPAAWKLSRATAASSLKLTSAGFRVDG